MSSEKGRRGAHAQRRTMEEWSTQPRTCPPPWPTTRISTRGERNDPETTTVRTDPRRPRAQPNEMRACNAGFKPKKRENVASPPRRNPARTGTNRQDMASTRKKRKAMANQARPASCRFTPMSNAWVKEAVQRIERDFNRSADTHLIKVPLAGCPGVDLYLKDESIHPSGSLKHRLARSLFLYGICNGWINEGTPVVEASSGSTAVSEAYFARLLDIPFHAVMPARTSRQKIKKIEFLGGTCHLVEGEDVYGAADRLAAELGGHAMDQFTYAERATDWRGNNNIAESLFQQMREERFAEPTWVVTSAGTGGTSATIGRFIRYQKLSTRLCVADPEFSVFAEYFRTGDRSLRSDRGPRIEGIGRPRVEPSFIRSVVDRVIQVPDAASMATIRVLDLLIDRKCGGSTGTNLWAAAEIISEMVARGEEGSVVTLICDGGERYMDTYYDDGWLASQGLDIGPPTTRLAGFLQSGRLASSDD